MFSEEDFRRAPVTSTLCGVMIAVELGITLLALSNPGNESAVRMRYYNDYRLGIWIQIWQSGWCQRHLGLWWPDFVGEWWRPFTTTLLHGNLLHAFFNVSATMYLGAPVERWLGSLRYFGLIVLLAYVSSLTEFTLWPIVAPLFFVDGTPNALVGFSGVAFGLFGFVWACRNYRGEFMEICPDQAVQWMMGWFLLCFVLSVTDVMPVANMAHAGGLGLGLALGYATVEREEKQIAWIILVNAVSLVALGTLLYCPWHPFWQFRHFG